MNARAQSIKHFRRPTVTFQFDLKAGVKCSVTVRTNAVCSPFV